MAQYTDSGIECSVDVNMAFTCSSDPLKVFMEQAYAARSPEAYGLDSVSQDVGMNASIVNDVQKLYEAGLISDEVSTNMYVDGQQLSVKAAVGNILEEVKSDPGTFGLSQDGNGEFTSTNPSMEMGEYVSPDFQI